MGYASFIVKVHEFLAELQVELVVHERRQTAKQFHVRVALDSPAAVRTVLAAPRAKKLKYLPYFGLRVTSLSAFGKEAFKYSIASLPRVCGCHCAYQHVMQILDRIMELSSRARNLMEHISPAQRFIIPIFNWDASRGRALIQVFFWCPFSKDSRKLLRLPFSLTLGLTCAFTVLIVRHLYRDRSENCSCDVCRISQRNQ